MKDYSKILTKLFLQQEYTINKKSTHQIAREQQCGTTTIIRYLKINNIPRRTILQSKQLNSKYFKILTKDFLYKEYITNKKSAGKIADEIGCNKTIILYYLKKNKIKFRTLKEARMLLNIKGEANPNYRDGRTLKIHYCQDCGEVINWITDVYGQGRCIVCSNKGEHNSRFNNWSSLEPYPVKWTNVLKESIRIRDNHRCQICGKTQVENKQRLSVHHIDYDKKNLNPDNLISLCSACHSETNGNRDYWQIHLENKILKFNNI